MSARNGTRSTSGKANDKGKAKVETSKVTISVTSSSGKKVKHLESERVRYQRTGGTKAQSTPSVSPEGMPMSQESTDTMGATADKEAKRLEDEMPPLEPNQSSEEKIRELQRKVEELEATLSATVSANEEQKGDLSQRLQAEEEKVFQIEKDKRDIQAECESYRKELERLKEQPANIQVPSVACIDKDDASDEEYKSLEQPWVRVGGASVPLKHGGPSTAEAEERHQQNHEIQFQKSVRGSNNQISGQTVKIESNTEELQLRLIKVEAEKDAALQEQERLAKEVARLEDEKMAQAKHMEIAAAKDRSEIERECVRLTRECESLIGQNESLHGLLDGRDVGNRGSLSGSTVEDKLADASKPVSQSLEPKQHSSLQHSRSKMSNVRRHASCDATLSAGDDDVSSDLDSSYCIIPFARRRSEESDQWLSEHEQTAGLPRSTSDHQLKVLQREIEQLRTEKKELQGKCNTAATSADAMQMRNEQLMKEGESAKARVSASQKRNQELQASCTSLQQNLAQTQQSLTQALEESEARKQHEQILMQQLNEKLVLEKTLEEELGKEKKTKRELAEMCEQLQEQLKAYEEDFNAERRDRESAHDKFADQEKKWMDQLENLTQERDRLTRDIRTLKDQLVAMKREFDAKRKEASKESSAVKALKADLANKDEEIQRKSDEIRGLQPIADQYRVLFAEKKELQNQFDALVTTNHALQQMLRDLQGEKAATDSRVKELTMVVGQVTAENEMLNQQNSALKQQNESFETIFTGMKTKSQALEVENAQLKEAICLPDQQITPRSSLMPPQSLNEGRRSLPSPISQRHNQPLAHPPPPNQPPLYPNPGDYRQHGAATYSTPEEQIALYGKPYSENALIMKQDLPGPHDVMEETDSPPSSKGDEQHSPQHSKDLHSRRPPAQPTALGDPHRAAQRDPRHKPQFPHSGPSVLGSRAHALPELEHRPAAGGGGRPIKYPPSSSERYQAATQPPVDASRVHLYHSNSSASETSLSLPAPLTNRRPDSEASDPSLPGFEANRRYIGEDINREIRHEARRYKEDNVAVEPADTDAEAWPFDPNLTCTFCGTMFRRGQIREFRYHVDECTARSMEGRK